jgi:hypothetical protein
MLNARSIPKREQASIARSGVRATRVASSHEIRGSRSDSEELLKIISTPRLVDMMRVWGLGTRTGRIKLGLLRKDVKAELRSPWHSNGKPEIKHSKTWLARVNVESLIQHVGLGVSTGSVLHICVTETSSFVKAKRFEARFGTLWKFGRNHTFVRLAWRPLQEKPARRPSGFSRPALAHGLSDPPLLHTRHSAFQSFYVDIR